MKLEQVVALIVRLFVIDFFIDNGFPMGVRLISAIAEAKGAFGAGEIISGALLIIIITILMLLWKSALFVAKKIIPGSNNEIMKISLTFEELETLCFSILGFWIAISGLLGAVQYVLDVGILKLQGATALVHFLGCIVQFAIGVWIVLGVKGITKTIRKLRS